MKSFLIIGMGHFGQNLAERFLELGDDVMIVDKDENLINELSPHYPNAFIGNCTNIDVLRRLGVNNFDTVFVAIGNDFQSSLEITSLLKDLGAKFVVSKANREIQAKFLSRNGADEVVYPERDIAAKLAVRFNAEDIFDYLEITAEYGIIEAAVLPEWVHHSLRELELRTKYNITVIAVKNGAVLQPTPSPDYIFAATDHIVMIGKTNDLLHFGSPKKTGKKAKSL